MLVLGMAALPLSLTLSRVTNGLTRPFFGWVSDHIGREATMALAFSLEAVAITVARAAIRSIGRAGCYIRSQSSARSAASVVAGSIRPASSRSTVRARRSSNHATISS